MKLDLAGVCDLERVADVALLLQTSNRIVCVNLQRNFLEGLGVYLFL